MDENTLLDLYLNKDPRGVEESLIAYGYTCRRIAMNILAGEREAELCIREAAEQAMKNPPSRSDPTISPEIHLQKLTHSLALDRYAASQAAKRGYNLFSTITDELEAWLPSSETVAAPSEAADVGEGLSRFLSKKDRETRDIFVCRYFYAESLTEITRRFGIQENRVKSRLRRTCKQLVAFWAQEGSSPPLSPDRLLRGMSHLDNAMIRSAHGEAKRIRRLIPWAAAFCAVVILAVSFPYLRQVINTDLILRDPDWDKDTDQVGDAEVAVKPDEEAILGVGSFASTGGCSITLTAVTDTTVTLTLVKTNDTPLYAAVYDRMGDALACTDPSYKVDGVIIRHGRIKVYANGEDTPATELPTAPGNYTLTLDFTSVRNGTYPMEDYVGFFAYTGKGGSPEAVYFSLHYAKETTTETPLETDADTTETDGRS